MTLKLTLEGLGAIFIDTGMFETIQKDPKIIKIGPLVFQLDILL